ncbi:Farnesyl-diphosphate farnesyltransferase [Datura stramonium]|uniref:Farnesyl-diphosphate farnesyltransferase n=1 Tax=Datura stramonium TaxID=4076 RepID=A0ABS8V1L9_DATST|nr:Farnesyl-diphosphate farnesyltransferase [Datura stramonium]
MKHPDELFPLMKLMLLAKRVEKKATPLQPPHWAFCYITLRKVSRSFALVIQQLPTDLRDVVCVYYLVLRALDTVEDDTSLAIEVRVPILRISTATSMILNGIFHVETIDDYNEYCYYAAGLCGLGLSKLFCASGREDLAPESLSISMGLFLQDFKYEENSVKAVQCLNEMVNNALLHAEDCLTYMSNLRDPAIFQFCAIPQASVLRLLIRQRRWLMSTELSSTSVV